MLRKVKPNDRTGKRFRASAGRTNVLTPELFTSYKEKYPKSEIDYKTFKGVIARLSTLIINHVQEDRDGYQLPQMLGYLFVGSYKPARKAIDYKKSQELGLEVYHNNFDTDGLACKIFFSNYASKYKMVFRQLWKFKAHRTFQDQVSQTFKKNYKIYKHMHQQDNAWRIIHRQ